MNIYCKSKHFRITEDRNQFYPQISLNGETWLFLNPTSHTSLYEAMKAKETGVSTSKRSTGYINKQIGV